MGRVVGTIPHPFAGDTRLFVTLIDLGEAVEENNAGSGGSNSASSGGSSGSNAGIDNLDDGSGLASGLESGLKALFGLDMKLNDAGTALVHGREYRMAVTAHPLAPTPTASLNPTTTTLLSAAIATTTTTTTTTLPLTPIKESEVPSSSVVGQHIVCLTNIKARRIKEVHSSALILFSRGSTGN